MTNTKKLLIALAVVIQILVISVAINIWQQQFSGKQAATLDRQNKMIDQLIKCK
jgi:hypothetical protein